MNGVLTIANERKRQKEVEGWTPEHDAQHTKGELADAAAAYAMTPNQKSQNLFLDLWPWDAKWWKPTPENRVKELGKAGALCAAEIDRIHAADPDYIKLEPVDKVGQVDTKYKDLKSLIESDFNGPGSIELLFKVRQLAQIAIIEIGNNEF